MDASPETTIKEPDQSPAAASTHSQSPSTRKEQGVIATVLAGVLGVLMLQAIVSRQSGGSVELQRLPEREFDYRIDINTAQPMELHHLPGIGPGLAERILKERENGAFASLAELSRRVKGIGPKTAERIAPYLRWTPSPTPGGPP